MMMWKSKQLYSVGPDLDRAGHLCEKQHGHESQRLLVAPLPPPGAFPLFSFLQKIATSFVLFFLPSFYEIFYYVILKILPYGQFSPKFPTTVVRNSENSF
jgi:hypothetical protein